MMATGAAEIVNRAPHVRSVMVEEDKNQVLGVIEANLKMPSAYRKGLLDRVLEDAVSALRRPLSPSSADDLAECIAQAIMRDAQRWRDVGAVMYAGIAISSDEVDVCTAGDLRVHLVAKGEAIRTTRDHNAVDDDLAGEYRDHFEGRRDLLQQVPTRALPATGQRRPESVVWRFHRPAVVLVCSSVVHCYRDPSEYVAALVEPPIEVPDLGFVASVVLR